MRFYPFFNVELLFIAIFVFCFVSVGFIEIIVKIANIIKSIVSIKIVLVFSILHPCCYLMIILFLVTYNVFRKYGSISRK